MSAPDTAATEVAALREALSRALAADQAKDDFLSMLGHELRNPLNAIATAAQVLQRADGHSPEAGSARHIVLRQTRALASMLDGLMDVGRIIAGQTDLQCQPFDLAPLVQRAVAACRGEADAKRQELDAVLGDVTVHADAKRIAQVIERLLAAAIRHTPVGGRIAVELLGRPSIAFLCVRHSGSTIAPEMLARIFGPDATCGLAQRNGGAGIGLTLVRRLVELHGGTAHGRGEAGETVFEIRLPAIAGDTPAP